MSKRLGGIIGCKYKTSSWYLDGFSIHSGRQACGRTSRGHTGFLHLPSAMLALIFLAGRVQPFLSNADREVELLCTNELIVLHLLGILFYFSIFLRRKIPVRVTAPGFVTSQRQTVSRLPTEPPGRPVSHAVVQLGDFKPSCHLPRRLAS